MRQRNGSDWRKRGTAALAALLLASGLASCAGPDRDRNSAIGDTSPARQQGAGNGVATAPGIRGTANNADTQGDRIRPYDRRMSTRSNAGGVPIGPGADAGGLGAGADNGAGVPGVGGGPGADAGGPGGGADNGAGVPGVGGGSGTAPDFGGADDGQAVGEADGSAAAPGGAQAGTPATVPFETRNGVAFADVARIAELIGFNLSWSEDGKTLQIGDTDPVMEFITGSSQATKEESPLDLGGAAVKEGNRLLVPAAALTRLFGDEAPIVVGDSSASLAGADDRSGAFGEEGAANGQGGPQAMSADGMGILSKSTDIVAFARRYMGVPYKFGTAGYQRTRRFDCSSFTQYVFRRHGINLPRTARAQGKHGRLISRSNLRTGDLMFFYVPGRFKSNMKVGHVAIYMGGGRMIHSSPLPRDGVQITPIDKEYWRDTFLFAKRYT